MALRASISVEVLQASVSSAKASASITYELAHATGIWTDPDSKNRVLRDEYALSDVRFNLVEKNVADNFSFSDTHYADTTLGKTDAISFTETFLNVIHYNRHFTDAFTLDDLSQIDKDFYGNKGNIFAFTDVVGLTHNKKLTDDYTVADVVTMVIAYSRTFNDPINMGDSSYAGVSKVETDIMSVADAVANTFASNKTDDFAFSDARSINPNLGKSDDFTFTDTNTVQAHKVFNDYINLDDAALIDKDYFGNKGNVFGLNDIFNRSVAYNRAYTDDFNFSDTQSTTVHKYFHESIIVYDDSVLNGALGSNIVNSNLLNGPAPAYTGPSSINIDYTNGTPENLTFADVASRVSNKNITESLTFSETYGLQLSKNITDGFALDDAALVDKDFYGTKGNIVSMNDLVAVTKISGRLLNGAAFNRTQIN